MSESFPVTIWVCWNHGKVRYCDGVKLRDLGKMKCKGNVEAWCHNHQVRFFEELPTHLMQGLSFQALPRRRRVCWRRMRS